MNPEKLFMHRCLDIALNGIGNVAPNPLVGCVIVHDGKIMGEGFHEVYGGPHAEVNAINNVETLGHSKLLPHSTLYVNLEPCAHHGKTPPCADLIISKKIPKVVIGCVDPNPLVAGKGIQKLKDAGVEVVVGVLEEECSFLNRRFFTSVEKKRPYIILKWAQTKDGFMATKDRQPKQISNALSQELVHKWRSEEAAILVGYNTAFFDNPQLNVRLWKGKNPLRCVIDKGLMLPQNLHLFDGKTPTIVFNSMNEEKQNNLQLIRLNFSGNWLKELLQCLHKLNIQSVIIEGGVNTLETFITQSLWDEARVFTSEEEWKEGIEAPELNISVSASEKLQSDTLQFFYNNTP